MAVCFWYIGKRGFPSVRYYTIVTFYNVQCDQLYMAVCFWYIGKRGFPSVRYYTIVTFYNVYWVTS